MFEVMDGLNDGVVGVTAVGTIGREDYESTLLPLIDEAVAEHGKIAAVIVLGPEFEGYSAGAAFDDMRLGFDHATAFRRIAVVSDNEWIRNGAAALMYLFPGKAKGFATADVDAAKAWASEPD